MLAHLSILLPCHLQEPHLISTSDMKMSPLGRKFLPQRWYSFCTTFRYFCGEKRYLRHLHPPVCPAHPQAFETRGVHTSAAAFSYAGSESPSGTRWFPAPGKHEYGSMQWFFLSFPLSLPWACSVLTSAASRAANTNKDLSK